DFDVRPTAELYDPDTGTFSATGSTAYPGSLTAAATLLMNGKVLITLWAPCYFSDLAEVFNPPTGMFTATGNMTTARLTGTSTLLPDGKVLIAGRASVYPCCGSADLYDSVTGKFETADDLVTYREQGYGATLLSNGTVLMSGGWVCCGYTIDTAEIYH